MNEKANKILIANFELETADKEYPWALPKGCRWFTLHARTAVALRIAVEPDHVANSQPNYFTLKANTSWDEKEFKVDGKYGYPLYFACGTAGTVIEAFVGIYDPDLEVA